MSAQVIDLRGQIMPTPRLVAPFPWFGGKRRVAHIVWRAFGDVHNYVEPFFGSGAVLLGRPTPPKIETINDLDCYVANFWRAVQADADAVAKWCDWPVNEADLHARHRWLIEQKEWLREQVMGDPHFFDAKTAGWWVWGICMWIGKGWCESKSNQLPDLHGHGKGVHRREVEPSEFLRRLMARLRHVRIACGDWSRVTSGSVTWQHGMTGVLLDPPYANTAGRDPKLYREDSLTVAHDVREWAIANGDDPRMRIALCGYEGEHDMPDDWTVVKWGANGGYGNQRKSGTNENDKRERIWFSPHCVPIGAARQQLLFGGIQEDV